VDGLELLLSGPRLNISAATEQIEAGSRLPLSQAIFHQGLNQTSPCSLWSSSPFRCWLVLPVPDTSTNKLLQDEPWIATSVS